MILGSAFPARLDAANPVMTQQQQHGDSALPPVDSQRTAGGHPYPFRSATSAEGRGQRLGFGRRRRPTPPDSAGSTGSRARGRGSNMMFRAGEPVSGAAAGLPRTTASWVAAAARPHAHAPTLTSRLTGSGMYSDAEDGSGGKRRFTVKSIFKFLYLVMRTSSIHGFNHLTDKNRHFSERYLSLSSRYGTHVFCADT